jgi:hypothetical protein
VIAKKLNALKRKTPSQRRKPSKKHRAAYWTSGMVKSILCNRRVLGEMKNGKMGWIKIYPAIVTEDNFNRAHAEIAARSKRGGRNAHKTGNLFTGLLNYHGSKMTLVNKGKHIYLANVAGISGARKYGAFPYPIFEECFLRELKEFEPPTKDGEPSPQQKIHSLQVQLDAVEKNRQKTLAYLEKEAKESFLELLEKYDQQKNSVLAKIEEVKKEAVKMGFKGGRELISMPGISRIGIKSILRQMIAKIEIDIVEQYQHTDFTLGKKEDGHWYIDGKYPAKEWCRKKHRSFNTMMYRHTHRMGLGKKIKEINACVYFRNGWMREIFIDSLGNSKSQKWIPAIDAVKIWHEAK